MFKAGSRIKFSAEDRTVHGTVRKVNSKNYVVIGDGGEHKYTVPFDMATHSSAPKVDLPIDCMVSWNVAKYKTVPQLSEETTCYDADILFNGVIVLKASNEGKGGVDLYRTVKNSYGIDDKIFHEECELWINEHYGEPKKATDCEAAWILWKVQYQYGNIYPSEFLKTYFGGK